MLTRQGEGQMDKASTEERILAVATEEFASHGFYGSRSQAIANAAGVNKAMLHYYFRSKENLYSQVIQAAFRKIHTRVGIGTSMFLCLTLGIRYDREQLCHDKRE